MKVRPSEVTPSPQYPCRFTKEGSSRVASIVRAAAVGAVVAALSAGCEREKPFIMGKAPATTPVSATSFATGSGMSIDTSSSLVASEGAATSSSVPREIPNVLVGEPAPPPTPAGFASGSRDQLSSKTLEADFVLTSLTLVSTPDPS